jgi:DNA modification methylase
LNKIFFGDCVQSLKALPEKFVNTCVTSPPYFGLRDYGHEGQIGLESTPAEYISKMVEVFREVRRVLRDDGTLWLNIGDSYSDSGIVNTGKREGKGKAETRIRPKQCGLKPKDLIGIPWMLAFALRTDGWWLRQDIIWHKPNPMPESVTDRCTKAHEYLFLLSKSERYYFDHELIKEPVAESTKSRLQQDVAGQEGSTRVPGKTNGNMKAVGNAETRNRRDVWTVSTKPYKGAHFATFPPDLITPCVLAGCPPEGIVLDPFMGSGTTAMVAMTHGRRYVGCELNPAYEPLQNERIAKLFADIL